MSSEDSGVDSGVETPASEEAFAELEVLAAGVEDVVLLSVHAAMDSAIAAAIMTARIFFILVYSF